MPMTMLMKQNREGKHSLVATVMTSLVEKTLCEEPGMGDTVKPQRRLQ